MDRLTIKQIKIILNSGFYALYSISFSSFVKYDFWNISEMIFTVKLYFRHFDELLKYFKNKLWIILRKIGCWFAFTFQNVTGDQFYYFIQFSSYILHKLHCTPYLLLYTMFHVPVTTYSLNHLKVFIIQKKFVIAKLLQLYLIFFNDIVKKT